MLKTIKSFDGTPIAYRVHKKSANYIMFVHGVSCNMDFWSKEENIFRNMGFSTIAPDLRGHGRSGKPNSKSSYFVENFAMDIKEILKEEKIKKLNLVGHSFGGSIGIIYYKLFAKDLKSMVLVNADYKVPLKLRILAKTGLILPYIRKQYNLGGNEPVTYNILNMIIENMSAYSNDYAEDIKRTMNNIRIPSLFISSKKDELIPLKHMEAMAHMMRNAEIVEVEGTHHDLFHEYKNTARYAILDFLHNHHLTKNVNYASAVTLLAVSAAIGVLSSSVLTQLIKQGAITGAAVINITGATVIIPDKASLAATITMVSTVMISLFVYFKKRIKKS